MMPTPNSDTDPRARSLAELPKGPAPFDARPRPTPTLAELRRLRDDARLAQAEIAKRQKVLDRELEKLDPDLRPAAKLERVRAMRTEAVKNLGPTLDDVEVRMREALQVDRGEVRRAFFRRAASADPQRSMFWAARFGSAPDGVLPGHAQDAAGANDSVRIGLMYEALRARAGTLAEGAEKAALAVLDAYRPPELEASMAILRELGVMAREISIGRNLLERGARPRGVELIRLGLAQRQAEQG